MKIKCYIVDDEKFAIDFLARFIERSPDLELVGGSSDPADALEKILGGEIITDVVFLDIEMPQLSGLDFAGQVGHLARIVFVTGNATKSLKAFDLGAIDYLLKPLSYERLQICTDRLKNDLSNKLQTSPKIIDKIVIRHGINNTVSYLAQNEIVYIEANSNYSIIHTVKNTSIRTRSHLSEMESYLKGPFLRVHRSFIINLDKISSFTDNTIVLGEKTKVPLGQHYRDEFIRVTQGNGNR